MCEPSPMLRAERRLSAADAAAIQAACSAPGSDLRAVAKRFNLRLIEGKRHA